jgi:general secretion pathway protein A
MYLDFYNLKKEPFKNSPDPDFFYLSPRHREALASIIYGVEQRKGFITITGEVGVGKTSILRYYLEQVFKENIKTIYIFNPALSFSALMKDILQKQGFSPKSDDSAELLNQFHQVLIDRFSKGLNVVLLIDEAQNMPVETIENLRMLSNLETSKEKLLQIVLVGQPELDDKLQLRELRQLRQRIAIKTTIAPLSKKESLLYIEHRLASASLEGPEMFTKRALKMIIAESRGVPRIMNILCDNALITGYAYQKKSINFGIAWEVINDFRGKKMSPSEIGLVIITAVLILVTGVFFAVLIRDHAFSPLTVAPRPALQENRIATDAGIRPIPIIKTVEKSDTL